MDVADDGDPQAGALERLQGLDGVVGEDVPGRVALDLVERRHQRGVEPEIRQDAQVGAAVQRGVGVDARTVQLVGHLRQPDRDLAEQYGTEPGDQARQDTYSIRNNPKETALPMRRLGSFLPGEGVGGAGVHWNGVTWRWPDHELRIRSKYEERYGKNYIPADMPLQDWGVTGEEIELYYDKFEYVAGVSGKAGNIKGVVQKEGNAFEDPRSRDYPLPPLIQNHGGQLFAAAASELGYHPFIRPTANASQPYTNPDGMKIGQCQYCGFCERFGCEVERKGQPADHGDPRGPEKSQRGASHVHLGHQGAEGFHRQEGHRRHLCERAHRRGDGAAGRPRDHRAPMSCPTST